MAINEEREEILVDYLAMDKDKAKKMLELSAEEAAREINKDGYDFTADELKSFAENIEKINASDKENGELDTDSLDNVSGGTSISAILRYITILGGPIMPRWR